MATSASTSVLPVVTGGGVGGVATLSVLLQAANTISIKKKKIGRRFLRLFIIGVCGLLDLGDRKFE
jgi:hypothetical protein